MTGNAEAQARGPQREPFETDIPARLDGLPWSRFHWLAVLTLGASWTIDGLEVTLAGAVSSVLREPGTLDLTAAGVGAAASFYLLGAVTGALACGHFTDRYGRARLLFLTLGVYLSGTLLSACAWSLPSLAAFRFITGFGIGGEYAAINSAIDELIPARVRGRVNLIINGSFWIGAFMGSGATLLFLDPRVFPVDLGWRLAFGIGAVLGLMVFAGRRRVPESPRWLCIHGYREQAEAVMSEIEARVGPGAAVDAASDAERLTVRPRTVTGLAVMFEIMFGRYRQRALLCFTLIAAQAFLYNAIFFTYALVLRAFYHVPAARSGLYLMPFAVANFVGPLVLGRWFDTIGRRRMIAGTYAVAGALLALTGALFAGALLSADGQTALWATIFFFASAAASAAYLTVSEIFPLELRAVAIAVFFALGTAAGGVFAPWLFGLLIATGSRLSVFYGYLLGAVLMGVAAVAEWRLGIDAERASLETVAVPLSVERRRESDARRAERNTN